MAIVRTVDFLPEIFQTPVNKQFLAATLDQVVQNPQFKRTQGYIGNKIGPGINANDIYISEPTKQREDYQLDPCVVSLVPDTNQVNDIITYPGITDTIALQGGTVNDADRLFKSDYYSWDPFVDFDKLTNYAQYYWLPFGPAPVVVSATTVPTTDEFYVTRTSNGYQFNRVTGNDPTVTLVRGGRYKFIVDQSYKDQTVYTVGDITPVPNSAFVINRQNNPTLTLVRGQTYQFNNVCSDPTSFYIKTKPTLGLTDTYDTGVMRNGAVTGLIAFTVPLTAPDQLYYVSSEKFNMRGDFNVVDPVPGTGPGFWIQSQPGVSGTLPEAHNISSRDVLGVTNNGTNTGEIIFDVPLATAQDFYYEGLTSIGSVDLLSSTLKYSDLQGVSVEDFLLSNPDGIDQISNLDGRTIVFLQSETGVNSWVKWYVEYQIIREIPTINLIAIQNINPLEKFEILFGDQYSRTEWYRSVDDQYLKVPLLTAVLDTLYYQDSLNPNMVGSFKLITEDLTTTILVDQDIIGQKNYTGPNGVVFTNGLKVHFQGSVEPISYLNNQYYVEGVGSSIQLLPVTNFIVPEPFFRKFPVPFDTFPYDIGGYDGYFDAPIDPEYIVSNRASLDRNPWCRSNRWFHIDVILATNEYNKNTNNIVELDSIVQGRRPILEYKPSLRLFNFGTYGLDPVNVIDFQETDALLNVNGATSYVVDNYTLVEGSIVIFAADTDPNVRKTIYKVRMIQTDPPTDGDYDDAPYATTPYSAPNAQMIPVIYLEAIYYAEVDDSTVCLDGQIASNDGTRILQGNYDAVPYDDTPYSAPKIENSDYYNNGVRGATFYYDGITWIYAQQQTTVNQQIYFNVYDPNGFSFGDREKYNSSNFYGSYLFSYALGTTGIDDPFLGFPLKYFSINNIGDIVFDNNLYTEEFKYVSDQVSITEPVSNGFVRQYHSRTEFTREIGWQNGATKSIDRQQLEFVYDGYPTRLDVLISDENIVSTIGVFINGKYISSKHYVLTTVFDKTQINWLTDYIIGDKIEVVVISNQISESGFYQVPMNLTNNPLNGNSPAFSLGTIRNHYSTICVTKPGFEGTVNGRNNTRDLGNLVPWGLQILQQSSPLTLAGYFMRSQEYDIFDAISYNNREYTQFKNQLLSTVVNNEFGFHSISEILDTCIDQINLGKTNYDSFYWSDMLPSSSKYQETSYTINPLTNGVFNTNQVFNFTSANFQALMIFLTSTDFSGHSITTLLEKGTDYIVSPDLPLVEVIVPLNIGDVVTVREYSNTAGNFVPNTPTKLGLYPKYRPQIFLDSTYITPRMVIQGHDGSITVAFNDLRDEVLLEFEKRIYNNLKTDGNPVPLVAEDVIPGFFRKTGYSQSDINNIMSVDFLSWVGWNKLDFKPQDFVESNSFTYNYSECGTKLDKLFQVDNVYEETMPGAWRGVYEYFYDTIDPSRTPWEMLGFSEMPCWWCDRYGPVPYTSGNLVLWTDLENGYVADPIAPYYLPKYARPGLTNVIPVNEDGELISPLFSVVGQFDEYSFKKSWKSGDGSPVEAAWWTSSAYPFAVMRLLALTRPAEFFSLFVDRDRYRFDYDLDQYLYDGRYRLGARGVEVYGDGVSKASYIDWIIDYNKQLGRNSTADLTKQLQYLTVRMGYRLGGYTDKQYLSVYADHAVPNNTNQERNIPVESYSISLYKNQPSSEVVYSALTIEITDKFQFRINGYDNIKPYFNAFISQSSGTLKTVTSGGVSVQVPANYTDKTVSVPYGTVFVNATMVVDFILSYGLYLESLGFTFNSIENGLLMNWSQMAQEFLYFSGQGWAPSTVINLNPAGVNFSVYRPGVVVDTVESITPGNIILDQNRNALPTRDLVIERLGNNFSITSATGRTVSFARLKFVSYEDILLLDNVTVFGDLIYDPITAARQIRVVINGWITEEWDGTLNAPGFVLNRKETIQEWSPNKKYTKGQIVLFKNNYWSALNIVRPKDKFEYSDWTLSDYTKINLGLLSNPPNSSDQLANSYDVYQANLNLDSDLLSYGLIGFRQRQYMTDLGLDSVSQVNLYQQFLGTKGTNRAAEIFTYADLSKETGTYNINEIWAILSATYGANANRSFIEFRLNETKLTSNPSTVEVIRPYQVSAANQTVLVSDIWRTSAVVTTPNVFPVTTNNFADTALPTAGYVDLEDVDITIFDINQPTSLMEKMNIVGQGTTVWSARINSYNWGVYRCETVPAQITQVSNNLNSTAVVQFSGRHGLSVGDIIVIRYVNSSIDGVYRVITVPGISTITISYSFSNTNQTTVYANGLAFYLQTTRVSQPSDVVNLPFATDLTFNSLVWVDNNGYGLWEVLSKKQPFDYTQSFVPQNSKTVDSYEYSLGQTYNDQLAFVGIPGSNNGRGTVDVYVLLEDPNNTKDQPYVFLTEFNLDTPKVEAFGSAIAVGQNTMTAIGANQSNDGMGYVLTLALTDSVGDYFNEQLLIPPSVNSNTVSTGHFGSSIDISFNEQWLYIGAPTDNQVVAYARVTVPNESVTYYGDKKTRRFNYSNSVLINSQFPEQLLVIVAEKELSYPKDYYLDKGDVVLTADKLPTSVQTVVISRRTIKELTITDGPVQTFLLLSYLYSATNINSFTVKLGSNILRPNIDYTFDQYSRILTVTAQITPGVRVEVIAQSYWQYATTISVDVTDGRFGQSVSCSTTGGQVIIGAPKSVSDRINTGSAYVYDRLTYHHEVVDSTVKTYIIPENNDGPISVLLNNVQLTDTRYYVNGQYTRSGDTIIIGPSVNLVVGDNIDISTTQFKFTQKLTTGESIASDFGYCSDFSPSNDEIFIGAPLDGTTIDQSGSVYRYVNQSRTYGVTTTTIANPVLTVGDSILINGMVVNVPVDNTVSGLVDVINSAGIPNVNAGITNNLVFYGNGVTTVFNVGSIYSEAASYNTLVLINNQVVPTDQYTYDNDLRVIRFNSAPKDHNIITVVSGRMTIVTKNIGTEAQYNSNLEGQNELSVSPGVGNAFVQLGFVTFVFAQTITSPRPTSAANFGYSLNVNKTSKSLVVGCPNGDVYEVTTFDSGITYFDSKSTIFSNTIFGSGVAFTYDYLPSANASAINPGKFVFGQQIYNNTLRNQDLFGQSVNYSGSSLIVGSPSRSHVGKVFEYKNTDDQPSWQIVHIQEPAVDSHGVNSVYMYNITTGKQQYYFDCINPLQGKILGAAAQNIDYIGAVDPANYNVGVIHNNGDSWGSGELGAIWWDTDTVRFIDPGQNDINYTSRRWGQIFPGSRVDIYQWISSVTPPIGYTGPGTPLSTTTYTLESKMNQQGYYEILYFFWVRGLNSIDVEAGKTLSCNAIAQYIADPRSSGIPYVALMGPSSFAIYNGTGYVSGSDTVIHIDYDQNYNTDTIHNQFQTVLENNANSFVNDVTYRKLIDSFAGADANENPVPDPMLSPGEKYGVQFRPRQSMFINRFEALRNYIGSTNDIIKQYPISESKSLLLLHTQELPPPSKSGNTINWNERVANKTILDYQDIKNKPNGYKYLVESNSDYKGLWTILEVDHTLVSNFKLVQIQSYYTPAYWNYINWYEPGYNPDTETVAEVPYYNSLQTLSIQVAPIGGTVRVTNNNRGKWELYKRLDVITWHRVGLQDGTIQFSDYLWNYEAGGFGYDNTVFDLSYYASEPLLETRSIIRAINEEIFVDEMKIYRNELLILVFEYIYSELQAPYWLMKTSLINVEHKIRALLPFEEYQPDNQTFVLDYINEVKPYHTVIKQFNLVYFGEDDSQCQVTDFDCPAYWDPNETVPQFVSPMLLPFVHADTTIVSNVGDTLPTAEIWALEPWKDWFDNYTLSVQTVDLVDSGQAYTIPPTVTVVGPCITPAIIRARIDIEGQVTSLEIESSGQGYTVTPSIVFTGDGTGAKAVAHLANIIYTNPVTEIDQTALFSRSIKTTIKYDRYQYASTIVAWKPAVSYEPGDMVRFANSVWRAIESNYSDQFEPLSWEIVPAAILSGVDRTMGYYAPTVNQPGLELPLLIDGVEYPGVNVFGTPFSPVSRQPYDTTNYAYGVFIDAPGSYDYSTPFNLVDLYKLDTIYTSNYTDLYLGRTYIDINVTGDNYISTDANYAPEELVLGATFDTVDIRVYNRPITVIDDREYVVPYDDSPYSKSLYDENIRYINNQGHGFAKGQVKWTYTTITPSINFGDLVVFPSTLLLTNQTTGRDLTIDIDYTVDWGTLVVTVINGAADGDVIVAELFGVGGGSEIFKEVYQNENLSQLLIDVVSDEIYTIAWFVDGELTTNISYAATPDNQTLVTLGTPLTSNQLGTIVVVSPTLVNGIPVDFSWSTPLQQIIPAVTGVSRYHLDNSMEYTNPVNLIVTINGLRARTASDIKYIANGVDTEYLSPGRLGIELNDRQPFDTTPFSPDAENFEPGSYSYSMPIAPEQVLVYVDGNQLLLGPDYQVVSAEDERVIVVFTVAPEKGHPIVIGVITGNDCYVDGNDLVMVTPVYDGDIISVISWNDPRQQDLLTRVFVGPVQEYVEVIQGYAMTSYSPALINGEPGSYNCSLYVPEFQNELILDRLIINPSRLWVTVNGRHIFYGDGFTTREVIAEQPYDSTLYDYADYNNTNGSYDFSFPTTEIVLPYILGPNDVVMVTEFTDVLNPDATAFRIFQDMRGIQTLHFMDRRTTTLLAEDLTADADIIYVKDASHLGAPNFDADLWGVLTINGERIMYREIDTVNNTVSSLLRGTAGTAAASHTIDSYVYDMGKETLLPKYCQNYTVANTTKSSGQLNYTAPDITISPEDTDVLRVYVGGIYQPDGWTVTSYAPVSIRLTDTPFIGVDVTIMVLRSNSCDDV